MRTLLAAIATVGGLMLAGAYLSPAAAIPFGPGPLASEAQNELLAEARWVCNRYGRQCVWYGPQRRTLYYGPPGWRHCEYRWRPSRRGPYRERICW